MLVINIFSSVNSQITQESGKNGALYEWTTLAEFKLT